MKTKYILGCLLSALAATAFVACSDDDEAALLRPAVDVTSNQTTVSSLTFHWPDRGDAAYWEYQLRNESGEVVAEGEVEKGGSRSLVFTGLQPNSKYTLDVTAVSATGERSTSSFTAKTNAVVKLGTPKVTASQSTNIVTVSWDAVTNAAYYYYEVKDDEYELYDFGKTTDTSVQLSELELGHYTITVKAFTGSESYSDSEYGSAEFDRVLGRMWYAPGTYKSANGTTVNSTIYGMEDGSYVIEAFYGNVGYDLEFTTDKYNSIVITNGEEINDEYWRVKTGVGDGYIDYAIDEGTFSGNYYSGSLVMNTAAGEDVYEWQAVDIPDFNEAIDIYIYNSNTGQFSDVITADAEVRGYTMTFTNFLGSSNTYVFSYDPDAGTASCTLTTGWNVGPFDFGTYGKYYAMYYYGDSYCSYNASSGVIMVQFYGYVTYPGDHYWMTMYIYTNN
jgi:hypothetical protein